MLPRYFSPFIFLLFAVATINLTSCKKTIFHSTENLSFSQDTVVFDTVFTTIGSTTKILKIYNNDSRTLVIQEIELMGGENSPFRINVDGLSGVNFGDLELEGRDSLFVFIEVTMDVNAGVWPMVVRDSIRFKTNGEDQFVQLRVWGQDAYFHYKDVNSGVWPNDKPHVVYGYAGIDEGQSLTIQAGTDIYFHKNSWLLVYKGELHVEGTKTNPVTFQGDRLEEEYDDVSGQYGGIYFLKAKSSTIDYAIIKNATNGIHLERESSMNTVNTLELSNTIISNCFGHGVLIFDGASVKAENCIISKNGITSLYVLRGGEFNFNHCHLLGYGSGNNVGPSVYVNNEYQDTISSVHGTITNSIIYGYSDYEIVLDTIPNSGISLNFNFSNNLVKSNTEFEAPFSTTIWNSNPLFKSIENNDFMVWSTSPIMNAGDGIYPITNSSTFGADISGNGRGALPDLGAYEY